MSSNISKQYSTSAVINCKISWVPFGFQAYMETTYCQKKKKKKKKKERKKANRLKSKTYMYIGLMDTNPPCHLTAKYSCTRLLLNLSGHMESKYGVATASRGLQ
jgi:hypothetical protein